MNARTPTKSSRWRRRLAMGAMLFGGLLWAPSCNVAPGTGSLLSTPCETMYGDACGRLCVAPTDCPVGMHCAGNACTAECGPTLACQGDMTCNAEGRCEGTSTIEPGPPLVPDDPEEICADVSVAFERQIPSVALLIDQSGSMTAKFDDTNRWNAAYDALMAPEDGVVVTLQDEVRFGLSLYTSYDGGPTCPVLTEVNPPELGAWASMDEVYRGASPQDDTPTGDAIDALVPELLKAPKPRLILLVTDGEPDTCEVPDPQHGQAEAITAAAAAHEAGVDVVVLAVGSELSMSHQQEVANVGMGYAVDAECPNCAPIYRPDDRASLYEDMETIIDGVRTCRFTLNGEVDPMYASHGTVTLNGQDLGYGDDWTLASTHEIELLGDACQDVLDGGDDVIDGSFPCYAFVNPPK